jgi:hypothetical protein
VNAKQFLEPGPLTGKGAIEHGVAVNRDWCHTDTRPRLGLLDNSRIGQVTLGKGNLVRFKPGLESPAVGAGWEWNKPVLGDAQLPKPSWCSFDELPDDLVPPTVSGSRTRKKKIGA